MTKLFTLDADLIDWELLRRQKDWLSSIPADGILGLIDFIQDAVVAQGLATEVEIFGFSSAPLESQIQAALAAPDNDPPSSASFPVNRS